MNEVTSCSKWYSEFGLDFISSLLHCRMVVTFCGNDIQADILHLYGFSLNITPAQCGKWVPQGGLSCCSCTQCLPRALHCRCCKLSQGGQELQNTVVFQTEINKRTHNLWRLWTRKGLSLPPPVGEWGKQSMLNVLISRGQLRLQTHRCFPEQKTFPLPYAVSQGWRGHTETCICLHPYSEPLLWVWEFCHTPVQTVSQPHG